MNKKILLLLMITPVFGFASDAVFRFYVMGDWETNRDCFWNIAAKVYNDPLLWEILYNANRSKLPNPENPALTPQGLILEIPDISREGSTGLPANSTFF